MFGVATVLKSVIAMQPWAQFSPRCRSIEPPLPVFQTWVQACKPASASVGLDSASASNDDFRAPTELNPMSFLCIWRLWLPTTASAKAIVLDDPSVTELMPYDCWNVKSP